MRYPTRPPAPAEGDPPPTGGGGAPPPDRSDWVPSARLRDETAAKREALDRVQALERELAAERGKVKQYEPLASRVDELKAELKAAKTAHEQATASWLEERELFGLGLADANALDVLSLYHGKLPQEGRPSRVEYAKSLKADPTKAPVPLRPWFAPPADAPPAGNAPPGPQAGQAPPPPQGAPPRPPPTAPASGSTTYTADQITELYTTCQRTGNWKPWEEAQAAINGSLR